MIQLGMILGIIGFTFGTFFFLYAAKYYISSLFVMLFSTSSNGQKNGNGNGNGNGNNGDIKPPFVSIHLPMYNERRVMNRVLNACTSLDYDNYEVLVADDSSTKTLRLLTKDWKDHPKVKIVHRINREGWKAGALNNVIKFTNPDTKYVAVFDADFVPPSNIIQQFLPYFANGNGNNHANGNGYDVNGSGTIDKSEYSGISSRLDGWHANEKIAAVQGYQWHYLNKRLNWLTRGIRTEYAGSYVVERTTHQLLGSMKMIAGSVFMVKYDILKKYGWPTSLTEDWGLTLRMYADGHKVAYTPYIQVPAECPATISSLARQRMRWAEGHTFNVKKYFWKILKSPKISPLEKLQFAYLSTYYLQSLFFLVGTSSWITGAFLGIGLPFWTMALGFGVLFSNLLSLPIMNMTGLYLERNLRKDFLGLFSFLALTYILAPFQAYASFKGLISKKEGKWFRTVKTGKITEVLQKIQFRRVWHKAFPKRKAKDKVSKNKEQKEQKLEPIPAIKSESRTPLSKIHRWVISILIIGLLALPFILTFLLTKSPLLLVPPFLGVTSIAMLKRKMDQNTSPPSELEGLVYCPKISSGAYVNKNACNDCRYYHKRSKECKATRARVIESKPSERKRASKKEEKPSPKEVELSEKPPFNVCPACDRELFPKDKYCDRCGVELTDLKKRARNIKLSE